MLSATYYIEKQGPASGGGMHNGGFPKDKNIYYDYDHREKERSTHRPRHLARK